MGNKKVIFDVTAIYMRKNRKRTLTAFAGILLMVVLMTAVFVGKDTLMAYLADIAISERGSWHIQVYGLDSGQLKELSSLPYIDEIGISRDYGYTAFPQSGKPEYTPFLEIKGYSSPVFSWMNIHLLDGRYPENENEIIISQLALEDGADLHIGDHIDASFFRRYIHAFEKNEDAAEKDEDSSFLVFPYQENFLVHHGETKEAPAHFPWYPANDDFEELHEETGSTGSYTIVGFMESPYYELSGQGGYIALSGTPASVSSDEELNVVALVDLKKDTTSLFNDLAEITGDYRDFIANGTLLAFSSKSPDNNINSLMILFQAFFSLLIAVASAVLISNVFRISRRERSRYLGMLSSVGATRSQKRWSVYFEVFTLLIAALPLGFILGILLVKTAMALLSPHFDALLGMLDVHVLTGTAVHLPCRLIVSPGNILLTVLLCILTVWASAWAPALKAGKAGPVEAIRVNDEYRKKARTSPRLLSGSPLCLLALCQVRRSRHMTRGIVQSLVLISSLTLITAFGAGIVNDVIDHKASTPDIREGTAFEGYDYALVAEGRLYDALREEVIASDEVSAYKEGMADHLCGHLEGESFSAEYQDALREIVGRYFPEGIPADQEELLLGEGADISFGAIILHDDEFAAFAEKCGADAAALQPAQGTGEGLSSAGPVLVYDTLSISTDDYRFTFADRPQPGYRLIEVPHPLKTLPGETLPVWLWAKDDILEGRVTFAGYVTKELLSPYYKIRDSSPWMVMPETTYKNLYGSTEPGYDEETFLSLNRFLLFNVKDENSSLVKRFYAMNAESMDSLVIASGGLVSSYSSIKEVIASIIRIVSIFFVLFVAIIGVLNLYHSVMGRKIERFREMAVLSSAGITAPQRHKMLHLENLLLFFRSFLYSALLTGGSVYILRRMASAYIGRMVFHTPYALILTTYLITYLLLEGMTFLCYRQNDDESIMERLRKDAQ